MLEEEITLISHEFKLVQLIEPATELLLENGCHALPIFFNILILCAQSSSLTHVIFPASKEIVLGEIIVCTLTLYRGSCYSSYVYVHSLVLVPGYFP